MGRRRKRSGEAGTRTRKKAREEEEEVLNSSRPRKEGHEVGVVFEGDEEGRGRRGEGQEEKLNQKQVVVEKQEEGK